MDVAQFGGSMGRMIAEEYQVKGSKLENLIATLSKTLDHMKG